MFCGSGTCADEQTCVTITGANCNDQIFQTRCPEGAANHKNCVVDCVGGGEDEPGTAHLCHQKQDCGYRTDSTGALPQVRNGLYPAYVPDRWTSPPSSTKSCPDHYEGMDSQDYCLGEDVLFKYLKQNPTNKKDSDQGNKDAIDQTLDDFTETVRGMGESEKGYFCLPQEKKGWRYTVFPAPDPDEASQCTVADCLVHALSSNGVAKVYYDETSHACMAMSCEGPDCVKLSSPPKSSQASSASNSKVGEPAKACDAGAIYQDIKTACETANPDLTCGGWPEIGDNMQMWTKDSDLIKIYANTCGGAGGYTIWADTNDGHTVWNWPSALNSTQWIPKQTAFEWWKTNQYAQFRVDHWYQWRDLARVSLRRPPGHGLNELYFHFNGCHSFDGDCFSSQEDCDPCGPCPPNPNNLADGMCFGDGKTPVHCPTGDAICNPSTCKDCRTLDDC